MRVTTKETAAKTLRLDSFAAQANSIDWNLV